MTHGSGSLVSVRQSGVLGGNGRSLVTRSGCRAGSRSVGTSGSDGFASEPASFGTPGVSLFSGGLSVIRLPLFLPPCLNGVTSDRPASRWRQRGRASLAPLRRPQLAEGHCSGVSRVWCLGWRFDLSGGFLNDLVGQLIRVAGTFTCSERHVPIVAHTVPSDGGMRN
jgi:hypothetical protein